MHLLTPALLFAAFTTALDLTLRLPPHAPLPSYNPSTLPSSTAATLYTYNNTRTALLTTSNKFDFPRLPPGDYLLTIHCLDWTFPPGRVDVVTRQDGVERLDVHQTFWGNEWDNRGPWWGGGEGSAVVEVRPERPRDYYAERAGFSPLTFLKNPMMLMALFSLVLIVGLPYLMDNLDDDTRAEFEELQSKSPVTQAVSGNLTGSSRSSKQSGAASSGAGAIARDPRSRGGKEAESKEDDAENPMANLQNFDIAGWLAGATKR